MASASQKPQATTGDARKTPKVLGCSFKVFPEYQGESVFCKILCSKLELRQGPSLTAEVVEEKGKEDIIAIRNDNLAPDPESGWMEVRGLQHTFVPYSARSTDLEPLPYASHEVVEHLRSWWGSQIHQAENLILSRVKKVTKDPRHCRGQLLQVGILEGDDELKEKSGEDSYHRAVAFNVRSNLLVCQDGFTHFIRAGRVFRKGELLEACRVFPLKSSPGETLSPFAVKLDDGCFGMPLGYGACYAPAPNAAQANAEASLAEWTVGGGYVLLIHAKTTIFNGQLPMLFGKPKRLASPWTLDAPPKPKGIALQMEKPLGPETSGLVRWGLSELHGAGVFAMKPRPKGSVLELCPALPLDREDELAAQDYCMRFDAFGTIEPEAVCLNLGLGSLYNHSDCSNADYWYDRSLSTLTIIALEDIPVGAEIFLNYGEGYWKARSNLKK